MNLQSPKINVSKSPQAVFDFLGNIKNFEALMPENISKFEVLGDNKFLFALKGMPEIVLGAAGGKLDFSLTANINEVNASSSDVQLEFSGDFNPMMAMMIKGPITKFIETLATSIPNAI